MPLAIAGRVCGPVPTELLGQLLRCRSDGGWLAGWLIGVGAPSGGGEWHITLAVAQQRACTISEGGCQ